MPEPACYPRLPDGAASFHFAADVSASDGNPRESMLYNDGMENNGATINESPTQRENDERFMRLAIEQARLAAEAGEVPIGAVVVCDGEVVAEAHNHRETDQDPSAHAEFTAICQASRELERWRLPDCTVYVTLEPCVMCAGLMHQARISRCVYGAPDQKAGALGTLYSVHEDTRLNHNFEVTSGILADECVELLRDFFRARRKKRSE